MEVDSFRGLSTALNQILCESGYAAPVSHRWQRSWSLFLKALEVSRCGPEYAMEPASFLGTRRCRDLSQSQIRRAKVKKVEESTHMVYDFEVIDNQ